LTEKVLAALSLSGLAMGTDAHPLASTAAEMTPKAKIRFNMIVPL
jgi:hypothetical protein